MKWYWLSFVDPITNINSGCCNVQATNIPAAIAKSHILKINPGGEVMVLEMPAPELEPDILYSRQELVDLAYKTMSNTADMLQVPVEQLPANYVSPCYNTINCNQHN